MQMMTGNAERVQTDRQRREIERLALRPREPDPLQAGQAAKSVGVWKRGSAEKQQIGDLRQLLTGLKAGRGNHARNRWVASQRVQIDPLFGQRTRATCSQHLRVAVAYTFDWDDSGRIAESRAGCADFLESQPTHRLRTHATFGILQHAVSPEPI